MTVRPDTTHRIPSSSSPRSTSPASSPPVIHDEPPTERTPLLSSTESTHLQGAHTHAKPRPADPAPPHARHLALRHVRAAYLSLRKTTWRDAAQQVFVEPVKLLPATILGCLLNVLDGVSYGMIMCVLLWIDEGFWLIPRQVPGESDL